MDYSKVKIRKQLIGQTFGRLTVIGRDITKKRSYYLCKCNCENRTIKSVRSDHLTSGKIKSCGCLHNESMKNKRKDISNRRFGLLIAKEMVGTNNHGETLWRCICDCGEEKVTSVSYLLIGDTKSCGCLISKGELEIKNLLIQHNIQFKQQISFNSLLSPKGYELKFDFGIYNNFGILKHLIEFQGRQHYYDIDYLNSKQIQHHDKLKREWCNENQIRLIEIPYYKIGHIILEDLL